MPFAEIHNSVIDLRPGKRAARPTAGQQRIFAPRPSREPSRRPLPLRAKRRRMRALIAFVIFLLLAVAAWGVHWASYLPRFSISSISVAGTDSVPANLVRDYAQSILDDGSYHFLSRDDMFVYPRAVLERAIVGFFPRISSASVSRDSLFSNALTITVRERQQFALWCTDDTHAYCYAMDGGGFIFAQAPAVSASSTTQYIFEGGIATSTSSTGSGQASPIGQSFVPAHLPGIVALLTELGQSGFAPQGASINSDQDFSVALSGGFMLKASFGEDADTLAKNLQLVLSSDPLQGKEDQLEYIDLRFGDRVYYKLKGAAEATSTPP
jgi:cell division septal protein FtsQ